MVIAVDFDGTCVTHEYPRIGRYIGAQHILKRLVNEGHQLILYTMRSGKELADAVAWFQENKIELWGTNENPEQKRWTQSPKIYTHLYIDDAALGIPLCKGLKGERLYVNWSEVEEMLFPAEEAA